MALCVAPMATQKAQHEADSLAYSTQETREAPPQVQVAPSYQLTFTTHQLFSQTDVRDRDLHPCMRTACKSLWPPTLPRPDFSHLVLGSGVSRFNQSLRRSLQAADGWARCCKRSLDRTRLRNCLLHHFTRQEPFCFSHHHHHHHHPPPRVFSNQTCLAYNVHGNTYYLHGEKGRCVRRKEKKVQVSSISAKPCASSPLSSPKPKPIFLRVLS